MGNDAKKQPLIRFWRSFSLYIVTLNLHIFSSIFFNAVQHVLSLFKLLAIIISVL